MRFLSASTLRAFFILFAFLLGQASIAAAITELDDYEYIIIGSGAGGGVLAARLALYGANVLLIEAGNDQGTNPYEEVPVLFGYASENADISWSFYVRHYENDTMEALNSKATYTTPDNGTYIGLDPPEGSTLLGVWYPRGGTLGGSAAHNAMVTVFPYEEDWTELQTITGDDSWAPELMRDYFVRLEKNTYLLNNGNATAAGHGFDGWLGTSEIPLSYLSDDEKTLALITAAEQQLHGSYANITDTAELLDAFSLDANTNYTDRDETQGIYRVVEAVENGVRSSPRDFIWQVANATNSNGTKTYSLDVRLNCLMTEVLFTTPTDGSDPVAYGVNFLDGGNLYRASTLSADGDTGTPGTVNATQEIIVAGGAFNTPQILKLSGIGPAAELEAFNITVVSDLPGVGGNLQDHYEISTVVEFDEDFVLFSNCTFTLDASDPCLAQWEQGTGPYATNAIVTSGYWNTDNSSDEVRNAFVFAGPVYFRGYYEGYADLLLEDLKHWTWSVLQPHGHDTAGTVNLTSADPRDTPNITYRFFAEGTTGYADDLAILSSGIEFTRDIYDILNATDSPYHNAFTEVYPGANVSTAAEVDEYISTQTWGHHCSSTAKMGVSTDPLAVVDTNFKVFGVQGLRVVDASVFPMTPGFFPVVSVYMIAEKAADVIWAARSNSTTK